MVVTVQAVGDASGPSQRLETRDDSRFEHVSRPRQLRRGWSLFAERLQLRVDRFLKIFRFHAGFCRRLHFKHRTKNQRLLIHAHVLGDLLFIHKFLVQPAGSSTAQNRCREFRFGVARFENRRGQPGHVHARELHVVLDHSAPFGCDCRRVRLDLGNVLPALQRAEIFFHESPGFFGIEISDDCQAGVVWRVIQLEKIPHVFEFGGLDVGMRSDHIGVIRMLFRKNLVKHRLFHHAVRCVFHALAALVTDHILLIRKVGLVQLIRQVTHPIRLQP